MRRINQDIQRHTGNEWGVSIIYTALTKKAMQICFDAHKDQRDKGGMPYVFHPFYIADRMDTEEATIVALLHDVVEDSKISLDYLRECGFDESVIEAIACLTHKDSTPYMEYIERLKGNRIATKVKIADLRHNSDLSRLNTIGRSDLERKKKYLKAIDFLSFDEGLGKDQQG